MSRTNTWYKVITPTGPNHALVRYGDIAFIVDFQKRSVIQCRGNVALLPPHTTCIVFYEENEKAMGMGTYVFHQKHLLFVRLLWKQNTAIWIRTNEYQNNILHSFAMGHYTREQVVECFLRNAYPDTMLAKVSYQVWNWQGLCPLHIAAKAGHREAVRFLVDHCGAQVNTLSMYRVTVLMVAAYTGHGGILKTLLRRGAQTDIHVTGTTARALVQERYPQLLSLFSCGREACTNVPRRGARTCKGCGNIRYCSKACHLKNWKMHKPACLSQRQKRISERYCAYAAKKHNIDRRT